MRKNILIVGGTSGLGLALAERYAGAGHHVVVTGRRDPKNHGFKFYPLEMSSNTGFLIEDIRELSFRVGPINTLIYAAGYYQEGRVDELTDSAIMEMLHVGLTAPILLVQQLKNGPGRPLKVIFVTSSSQVTPREKEPVYTAAKAGLGMLGNSLGLDPDVGKVLVAAPAGMNTPFWDAGKDVSTFLDPGWVADEIIKLSSGPFKYRFAKILRDPARVEIVETR